MIHLLCCLKGPLKALQDEPWQGLSLSPRIFIGGTVCSSYLYRSVIDSQLENQRWLQRALDVFLARSQSRQGKTSFFAVNVLAHLLLIRRARLSESTDSFLNGCLAWQFDAPISASG